MRPGWILVLTAATLIAAAPLQGQATNEAEANAWELGGLRTSFCVQFLLAPASDVLRELPQGYRAVAASAAPDLHLSLRSVIEGQPEFASWAPSRLCFTAVDTIRAKDVQIADKSGRRPQLFGLWTVLAAGPSGTPEDVALDLFTNNGRLVTAARLAGQTMHEARLKVGKVPAEDENGVKSTDDRFQVQVRKATVTWDGRPAGDTTAVASTVESGWSAIGSRGAMVSGKVRLTPAYSEPMVGSLKVDGKSTFAQALRASPTRFAGPAYHGGGGRVAFNR